MVGSIDNFVYPSVIGNRVKMHTVIMFIALLGGLMLFGPIGLFLGPITISMTRSLLNAWREWKRRPGA